MHVLESTGKYWKVLESSLYRTVVRVVNADRNLAECNNSNSMGEQILWAAFHDRHFFRTTNFVDLSSSLQATADDATNNQAFFCIIWK